MKIKEVMSENVQVINEGKTIHDIAKMMKETDCGCIPVEKDEKLIGMVTDRDIVMWIANSDESLNPASTSVKECMTEGIKYCYEDDEVEDVIDNMAELKIRRMPIMNNDLQLVGIVSLGDISANMNADSKLESALQEVST